MLELVLALSLAGTLPTAASQPAAGKAEIAQAMAGLVGAPGKMTLALHDTAYHVAGDLGWATGLWTMKIETPAGKTQEEHGRSSALFVRRAGCWLYLMDHASVPVPPPPGAPAARPSN